MYLASGDRSTPHSRTTPGALYAELRRLVVAAGLLERTHRYYLAHGLICLALLGATIGVLLIAPNTFAWSALATLLLGFAGVQIGLIGHDAGHLAVFRDRRANWALGQVCWSLVNGIGFWFWLERHNSHHGHTNHIGADPEFASAGIIAFTEEDAAARRGVSRLMVRYQVVFVPLFIVFMLLLTLNLRIESWVYMFRHPRGSRRLDAVLLICNALASFAPVAVLGWRWVGVFMGSELIRGLYLSMIVAPNHKGMPVWTREVRLSFLEQQVLSSRNISSHPVWDFLYGGLNYQIEHHLFPTMPRSNFRQARAIVRPFCAEHGLPYEEVNPLRSYWLVLAELHRVSRAARPRSGRVSQG